MPTAYGLPKLIRKATLIAALAFAPPAWAVPAPAAPVRLMVLGDSLSAGYGLPHDRGFEVQLAAALAKAGHPVTIVDAAVSGDTSAGGLARLDWSLAPGVDAAIVELGGNDGLRGTDPREMQSNLTAILGRLAAKHIPVLLAGMYAPPNMGPDYGRQFRAVFDRLAQRPGVIYYPFFLAGVATVPGMDQPDHIHPDARGVQVIVTRILPDVEMLLAEAGQPGAVQANAERPAPVRPAVGQPGTVQPAATPPWIKP